MGRLNPARTELPGIRPSLAVVLNCGMGSRSYRLSNRIVICIPFVLESLPTVYVPQSSSKYLTGSVYAA